MTAISAYSSADTPRLRFSSSGQLNTGASYGRIANQHAILVRGTDKTKSRTGRSSKLGTVSMAYNAIRPGAKTDYHSPQITCRLPLVILPTPQSNILTH